MFQYEQVFTETKYKPNAYDYVRFSLYSEATINGAPNLIKIEMIRDIRWRMVEGEKSGAVRTMLNMIDTYDFDTDTFNEAVIVPEQ